MEEIREISRWRESFNGKDRAGCPLLTISGPSGTGKSTLTRALKLRWPAFVETTEGNAQLQLLLSGCFDKFDAAANQRWFLRQIAQFVAQARPDRPLVLDQDPAAIVFTYGRMWFDDGKISSVEFTQLVDSLLELEKQLQRWRRPRVVVFLDAPSVVLHQRVLERERGERVPPVAWYERVRTYFNSWVEFVPRARRFMTEETPATLIVDEVSQLLS